MPERTTIAMLDQLAHVINQTVQNPDMDDGYFVQGAYGRVRLMRAQGSVDVSPSLSKPELEQWMRAFHAGIIVGQLGERDRANSEVDPS